MLRDELKEAIKKSKQKCHTMRKKIDKKKKQKKVFRSVGVLCEDLMIEELDLEESLDKVLEYEAERNQIEGEYQEKIDKLGFELQTAKLRLMECKNTLERKNDQAEMIMRTKNQYKILSEDYKTTCELVQKKKGKNKELEGLYEIYEKEIEEKNKVYIDRMAKIDVRIQAFLGKNRDLADKIDRVNKELETAEEMKKKGSSANIELKKLRKWNDKKDQRIEELKDERDDLEQDKVDMEKRIQDYEAQLAGIEQKHARNLKNVIKSKEKILNNVYARNEVLRSYKEVSKSVRETEIRCLNKIEYQKSKNEILKKRIKALGFLERGIELPNSEINEKMMNIREIYKNKLKKFRDENMDLEFEVRQLRKQIAEIKLGKSLEMSDSESFALSESFIYSDIDSMIESISIQLSQQN